MRGRRAEDHGASSGMIDHHVFRPEWFGFLMFFALFFTTQMDFRNSEIVLNRSFDPQIIIRLLVLGGIFALNIPYLKLVLKQLKEIPSFFHLIYLAYLYVVSCNFETVNYYTFYALTTHILMLYVVLVMTARFGFNNMVYYYFIGTVVFGTISLVYYYAIPEIGRYTYWLHDGTLFQSTRLKGIGGHPNMLGFMMAAGVLSFVHLLARGYPMHKLLYPCVMIVLFCLILTNSRTSLGGMILMVGLYLSLAWRMFPFAVIGGIGMVGVMMYAAALPADWVTELLTMFSRSGELSELTTLTGRSHIWDVMFILIEKKPVFGWGYATLGDVLIANSDEVGFTVRQAHNLYLQVLFVGGFVGMFFFVISMIAALIPAIVKTLKERVAFELCIIVFILFSGITEAIIMTSVATNNYLLLALSLASLSIFCEKSRARTDE